ncbi:GPI-anchored wall transfer protein 1 [Melanomma pulvis-pyrius CBS 109.77]|uniref:GPI-anchored wall transfer protein n=1 Tax=Melanomma pulvis-pyrius CBS 109.77 TaxID=1314802 RepID=A0A6A6XQF9_9PLEO|nr:GPI-anchored wall transfer protein 1 [Melanomma pulvis-pyrius CBS 109.77]
MATSYKAMKEAWVTGLTGSSVADVNSVSLSMPLTLLLWSVLQSRMRLFTPYTPVACLVDFLLNCGATLVATTVYSSSPWLLNLLLALPAAFIFLTSRSPPARQTLPRPPKIDAALKQTPNPLPVKPFITHYRGSMMMITCVAILAVDFRIFPRRFAKVENWGTSLMDMGVGSFVFTSGVVSVRSSLKIEAGKRPSLYKCLITSIRHSIPLLILGYIRLLTVRGLDYAVHVTEYGIHWNFFFTLGFLPPFVALFQSAFDFIPSYALLSCILGSLYEIALDKTNLGKFILTAPRTDLISKNREGIFSFLGYLAIFLAGQSLGSFTLLRQQPIQKDTSAIKAIKQSILGKLVFSAVMWTVLFYFSISYYGLGLSVSRRLANLPYVLWVSAFNSAHVALCCAMESVCFPNLYKCTSKEEEIQKSRDATSPILFAFNRNGLVVFLVANLLTGLVNVTLPTLNMGVLESMAVLVGYMVAVSAVALGLDKLDLSIKL